MDKGNFFEPANLKKFKQKIDGLTQDKESTFIEELLIVQEKLKQFNSFFNQQRKNHTPKEIESLQGFPPQIKQYFLNQFFPALVRKLLSHGEYQSKPFFTVVDEFMQEAITLMVNFYYLRHVGLSETFKQLMDVKREYYVQNSSTEITQNDRFYYTDLIHPFEFEQQYKDWINSLKVGDQVDAIQINQEIDKGIWSRACVISNSDSSIQVEFLDDEDSVLTHFQSSSESSIMIMPFESRCDDFQWRRNLSEGQEIDVFDKFKIPYKSTILKIVSTKESQNGIIQKIQIGFRIYRENGDQTETDGRQYFGWQEQYDETLNIHSPQIEKLDLYSQTFTSEGQSQGIFDDKNDNLYRNLYERQGIHALLRPELSLKSSLAVKYINHFGACGGLKNIIQSLETLPFELLTNYLTGLGWVIEYFNRFIMRDQILPYFNYKVRKNLMESQDSQIRLMDHERLQCVYTAIETVLKRTHNIVDKQELIETLKKDMIIILLKSPFLKQKIMAMKYLSEFLQNTATFTKTEYKFYKDPKAIFPWLDENYVLNEICGSESHPQVISRCGEVLSQLYDEKFGYLDDNRIIDLLRNIRIADKDNKINILLTFKDMKRNLREKTNQVILRFFLDLPVSELTIEVVELVYQICYFKIEVKNNEIGMDIFFNALFHPLLQQREEKKTESISEKCLEKTAAESTIEPQVENSDIKSGQKEIQVNTTTNTSITTNDSNNEKIDGATKEQQIIENQVDVNEHHNDQLTHLDTQIQQKIIESFQKLIKNVSTKDQSVYEKKTVLIIEQIKKRNGTNYGLKLLKQIIDKLTIIGEPNPKSFSEAMVKKFQVPKIILENIKKNKQLFREFNQNGTKKDEGRTHLFDRLTRRIQFLRFLNKTCAKESQFLKFQFMSDIWSEFVDPANQIIDQELNLAFSLAKDLADDINQSLVDYVEGEQFFIDKLLTSDEKITESLTFEGFETFKALFLAVNEKKDNLLRLFNDKDKAKFKTDDFSKLDFDYQSNVHPHDILGIKFLKQIAFSSALDQSLAMRAIDLYIQIYCNLSVVMDTKKYDIRKELVDYMIAQIQEHAAPSGDHKKTELILEAMQFLFNYSEQIGNGNLPSHNSLVRGELLHITIYMNVFQLMESKKRLEKKLYSNQTIFQLRQDIAAHLMTTCECIQMTRKNLYGYDEEIKELENGKTLLDLKIRNNETITVKQLQKRPIPWAPLVQQDGGFTNRAQEVFDQIFKQYSEDGQMKKQQVQLLTTTVDGSQNPNAPQIETKANEFIRNLDKQKKGYISRDEYLNFYLTASKNKLDVVQRNLEMLGYMPDLQNFEASQTTITSVRTIPRAIFMRNKKTYDLLFGLLETHHEIQDTIWEVLRRLPPSPDLIKKITTLKEVKEEKGSRESWRSILEENQSYQNLYAMIIIEYLMQGEDQRDNPEVKKPVVAVAEPIKQIEQSKNPDKIEDTKSNQNKLKLEDVVKMVNDSKSKLTGLTQMEQIMEQLQLIIEEAGEEVIKFRLIPQEPLQIQNESQSAGNTPSYTSSSEASSVEIKQQYTTSDNEMTPNNLSPVGNSQETILEKQSISLEDDKRSIKSSISNTSDGILLTSKKLNFEISQWRSDFIEFGGFQQLFMIFQNSVKEGVQELNDLKANTLAFILQFIKDYLIASLYKKHPKSYFIASYAKVSNFNLDDLEICSKISLNELKPDAIKKIPETVKQHVIQQPANFLKMSDALEQTGIADQILQSINPREIMSEVMELCFKIFEKNQQPKPDERILIEYSMLISLTLSVVYDDALDFLLGVFRDKWAKVCIQGLFRSSDIQLRKLFLNYLYLMTKNRRAETHFVILRILFENIPIFSRMKGDVLKKRVNCAQFYELLCKLIQITFNKTNSKSLTENLSEKQAAAFEAEKEKFDLENLFSDLLKNIENHESSETRANVGQDSILIGYLYLMEAILSINTSFSQNSDIGSRLSKFLFEQCLFCLDAEQLLQETMQSHPNFQKQYLSGPCNGKEKIKEFMPAGYVKCKSSKSRKLAYSILLSVMKSNKNLLKQMLLNEIQSLLRGVPIAGPKTWNYRPANDSRSSLGYSGIRNLGAICYMNALLQQFFLTETFRYGIMTANDQKPENISEVEGRKFDDNVFHQLQKMFSFLEMSDRQAYDPRDFCSSFRGWDGQPVNVKEQKDTQQFLMALFDKLQESLQETPFEFLSENIFGGKFCSLMQCSNCGTQRERYEPFFTITVPVQNCTNLSQSLTKYIETQKLEFQCEKCLKRVQFDQCQLISHAPNVFLVQLHRIGYNIDTMMNEKTNSRLEFPQQLNILPFTQAFHDQEAAKAKKNQATKDEENKLNLSQTSATSSVQSANSGQQQESKGIEINEESKISESKVVGNEPEKAPQVEEELLDEAAFKQADEQIPIDEADYEYTLKGVTVHVGVADSGHYYSYIKISDQPNEQWAEFNDTLVQDFQKSDLESECFGSVSGSTSNEFGIEQYSKNAYFLVYEKQKQLPVDMRICNQENLDDLSQMYDLDQSNLKVSKKILEDQKNQEVDIITIDYHQIGKFIKRDAFQYLWMENHQFLLQRHIYSDDFFGFVKELLSNIEIPDDYIFPYDQVKNVNKYLYYDNYQQLDSTTVKLYQSILNFSSQFLFDILVRSNDPQESIIKFISLIPQKALEFWNQFVDVENSVIFEVLVACPEKNVQNTVQSIVNYCLNVIIKMEKITFLENENAPPAQKKICDLLDRWLMELNNQVASNWLKSQGILEVFACGGVEQLNFCFSRKFISRFSDFFLFKDSPLTEFGEKKFEMGNKYSQAPFSPVVNMIIHLILQANNFVGIHINPQFNSDFDSINLSYIINHMCNSDLEFSRKMAEILLLEFNNLNVYQIQQVKVVLLCVREYLAINDQFTQQRLEWVLGFPQLVHNDQGFYGLSSSLNDALYSFESTLEIENSLCILAFFQKQQIYTNIIMFTMFHLFTIAEFNDTLAEYLLLLPPFNFYQSSFLDWVAIYVQKYIEDSNKNSSSASNFNQEELGITTFKQYFLLLDQKEYFEKQRIQAKEKEEDISQVFLENIQKHQAKQNQLNQNSNPIEKIQINNQNSNIEIHSKQSGQKEEVKINQLKEPDQQIDDNNNNDNKNNTNYDNNDNNISKNPKEQPELIEQQQQDSQEIEENQINKVSQSDGFQQSTQPIDQPFYPLYIVGTTLDQYILDQRVVHEINGKPIEIEERECISNMTESKPNGKTNLIFPPQIINSEQSILKNQIHLDSNGIHLFQDMSFFQQQYYHQMHSLSDQEIQQMLSQQQGHSVKEQGKSNLNPNAMPFIDNDGMTPQDQYDQNKQKINPQHDDQQFENLQMEIEFLDQNSHQQNQQQQNQQNHQQNNSNEKQYIKYQLEIDGQLIEFVQEAPVPNFNNSQEPSANPQINGGRPLAAAAAAAGAGAAPGGNPHSDPNQNPIVAGKAAAALGMNHENSKSQDLEMGAPQPKAQGAKPNNNEEIPEDIHEYDQEEKMSSTGAMNRMPNSKQDQEFFFNVEIHQFVYIRRYFIYNRSDQQINFTLNFVPFQISTNCILPSAITRTLPPKQSQLLVSIHKLQPEQEWGDFKVECTIQQTEFQQMVPNISQVKPYEPSLIKKPNDQEPESSKSSQDEQLGKRKIDQEHKILQPVRPPPTPAGSASAASAVSSDTIACQVCTYVNSSLMNNCEMCDSQLK